MFIFRECAGALLFTRNSACRNFHADTRVDSFGSIFWLCFWHVFLFSFVKKSKKSYPGVGPSKKQLRRPLLANLHRFWVPLEGPWKVPRGAFFAKKGWHSLTFSSFCEILLPSGALWPFWAVFLLILNCFLAYFWNSSKHLGILFCDFWSRKAASTLVVYIAWQHQQ